MFLLFLFLPLSVFAQVNKDHRSNSTQFGILNDLGDSLIAEGVWRADNLNEKTELVFDSVSRLECYKSGGQQLVGSNAYCMEAVAQVSFGVPEIEVNYFPVIRWDKDMVIAANSATDPFPVCTWTQITISLQEHSIMTTDTRKLSKGHEGFNNSCSEVPLAQTYHLIDKVEELTRRRVRESNQKKK
jgi:hypothetical protein